MPRKKIQPKNGTPLRPLALVMLEGIVDAEFKRGRRWNMDGKPSLGAVELVEDLRALGYDVLVGASFVRPGTEGKRDATRLEAWLARKGFGPTRAVSRKSPPRAAHGMSELLRAGVVRINFRGFHLEVVRHP